MIVRCIDSRRRDFGRYGGRGILVCDRWLNSFENFLADMGEKPEGLTIERVNNNGNYNPENCKWATWTEQSQNKRTNPRQYWFYGHGPIGEMIINNNQSHTCKEFNLNIAHVCACLQGKLKQHKGWTFSRIGS